MTDLEFDILDELYFVQSFTYIQSQVGTEEATLKAGLAILLEKGWIRCFKSHQDEVVTEDELDFSTHYQDYYYLATKEGLLAHNTR
ncbi:MAG: hypothetical protein HC880_02750 [Bacteroidia bacterium]|nr:hypothetical protein [Bacteroidia bacterium]